MEKELTGEPKKEYETFMNEQFRILKGHFERIMLRVSNKYWELVVENSQIKGEAN